MNAKLPFSDMFVWPPQSGVTGGGGLIEGGSPQGPGKIDFPGKNQTPLIFDFFSAAQRPKNFCPFFACSRRFFLVFSQDPIFPKI